MKNQIYAHPIPPRPASPDRFPNLFQWITSAIRYSAAALACIAIFWFWACILFSFN